MNLRDLWASARMLIEGAWGRWPLPYRYRVVIVGRESGNRIPLDFVVFRNVQHAMLWCIVMNNKDREAGGGDLTYYDWEKIPKGRG